MAAGPRVRRRPMQPYGHATPPLPAAGAACPATTLPAMHLASSLLVVHVVVAAVHRAVAIGPCFWPNTCFNGPSFGGTDNVLSATACQGLCKAWVPAPTRCEYWFWQGDAKHCRMFDKLPANTTEPAKYDNICGTVDCKLPPPPPPPPPSPPPPPRPPSCYHWEMQFTGNVEPKLNSSSRLGSAAECQAMCEAQCECNFFMWAGGNARECTLFHSLPANTTAPPSADMCVGPAVCAPGHAITAMPPTFVPGAHACVPELTRCVDVDKLGFCSTNATLETRVIDLVSRLTLEEKQQLVVITGGGSQDKPGDGGVPRLGIPNCKSRM